MNIFLKTSKSHIVSECEVKLRERASCETESTVTEMVNKCRIARLNYSGKNRPVSEY